MSTWGSCFQISSDTLDYQRLYREYEEIIARFPAWSLNDVKSLPVRERRHWFNWAKVLRPE